MYAYFYEIVFDQSGIGCSENGAVSEHVLFSNPIQQASWYFWSDGNNVSEIWVDIGKWIRS